MTLVKLRKRSGRKFRGVRIKEQTTFHSVKVIVPGNRRVKESAKSTIRATQAATSSNVNRILVAMRAFRPKEI
jgi:hypothetical protein